MSALDDLIAGKSPVAANQTAPAASAKPTSNLDALLSSSVKATPKAAPLAPFVGKGYSPAKEIDTYSGKPLATVPMTIPKTFLSPQTTASVIDRTRVAPDTDPTLAQKTSTSTFENPRMPESASEAVRIADHATKDEQLDHTTARALGGSNMDENLVPVPTQQNQDAGKLEGKLVGDIASGKTSIIDAQKADLAQKGKTIKEDSAKTGPVDSYLLNNGSLLKGLASAQDKITGAGKAIFNAVSGIVEKNPITRFIAKTEAQGLSKSIASTWQDIKTSKAVTLDSDSINSIIARRQELIKSGTAKDEATIQATKEVKSKILESQLNNAVAGSLGGGEGAASEEEAAKGIESEAEQKTELEKGDTAEGETKAEPTENAPTENAEIPKTDFEKNRDAMPVVNTDEQAVNEAAVKTVAGGGKGVESLDKDTQETYRNWVNQAGASNKNVSGRIAAKPFTELAGEKGAGMDAVHAFQAGDRTGKLADVEKWGKDLLAKEQAAGLPVEARANYLPQYWANSQAEIDKATAKYFGENPGKSVSLNPGFSKEATFPDYATGEKYGLTPRYSNIPDMIGARVQASEKAIADRTFFDKLTSEGLLQPRGGAGWKTVDPDHFPNWGFQTSDGKIYNGTLKAPGPLADLINNQLRGPESGADRFFAATANWSTKLKSVVLSSGIPGTAVNLHGFNELAATVPELMNQPTLFTSALQYMVNPNAGAKFIDDNLEMAQDAARSGLVLGGEEHTLGPVAETAIEKGPLGKIRGTFDKGQDALYKLFAKNDFEKMIPALKLQMWSDGKDFLMKQGMSEADAAHAASVRSNQTFGGLNLAEMGRDKNLQNVIRSFVFAPDFWESRFRYAGNLGKSALGKGPMAKLYRNAALTIVGAYVGMNLANKAKTGHFMFENPSGHSMDILAGQDAQGKDVWVRPFGTDLDFIRLPLDIMQSLSQGDASGINTDVRNRVSTLLQPLLSWTTNSDAYGNKIFGPSTVSNPALKQWLTWGSSLPVFPQVGTGVQSLTDPTKSKFQAISQMIGLPIRFNVATTPSTSNLADQIFTERPVLESQIKQDYLNGNEQDALDKMSAYNKQVLQLTIQAYKDAGHQVTDEKAFTQFLLDNTRANGGLKDVFVKPPTEKVLTNAKAKQGQSTFKKLFPSNISP